MTRAKRDTYVDVTVHVPVETVAENLAAAFEGGSNYWYDIVDRTRPKRPKSHLGRGKPIPHVDWPLCEGGSLTISDERGCDGVNPRRAVLDMESIRSGLAVMAHQHPQHFADLVSRSGDAATADVFLQCCVLGDVIYG